MKKAEKCWTAGLGLHYCVALYYFCEQDQGLLVLEAVVNVYCSSFLTYEPNIRKETWGKNLT